MAVLRMVNGSDVTVKMSVADAVAALDIVQGNNGFVELPGADGPVHIRPSGVVAIVDDTPRGTAGFRVSSAG